LRYRAIPRTEEIAAMADAKTYVEVAKFSVKDIFDDKLKSRVVDLATKTAKAAVKQSSKLTDVEPKEKGAKGWSLLGGISVGPDKAGTKFVASLSLTVATWPGKSIKSMPSGSGAFAIEKGEKVSASDVDQVVKKATEEAMKLAVTFMETKKPE
jgi:hypothetical protein